MAADLSSKIYVAGHRGMVGSAIVRNLEVKGLPISSPARMLSLI